MDRSAQHAFEPEEIMAYLDGELEPRRAVELAGHFEHCDDCRTIATQFRQLSERLLDFSVESITANLNAAVLSGLESFEPAEKRALREVDEVVWNKLKRLVKGPTGWGMATAVVVALVVLVVVGVHEANAPQYSRWMNKDVEYVTNSPSAAPTDTVANSGLASRGKAPRFAPNAKERSQVSTDSEGGTASALATPAPSSPMIAQTAALTIIAADYEQASAAVDRLAAGQGGYVQKLATSDHIAASREFSATVRVPAAQLGGFLAELRKLGHVEQETRSNEEVTDQYVDLQARIKSARASEQRMLQLLATRTGKLEDVLDAERELARIREEIESMEGQRNVLAHRVSYATVEIQLREEYREQLHPGISSTTTGLRNSLAEGLRNLEDGVVGLLVFLFAYGPSILFWCALFLVPGYFIWRWARSRSHE